MACCGLLNLSPYFSIASSSYSAPRPTNRKLVTTTTPRTWTVTAISAATFAFIPRLCRLSLSLSSFLSPPPYLLMPPMPPSSSSIYRGRHSGRRAVRVPSHVFPLAGVWFGVGHWGWVRLRNPASGCRLNLETSEPHCYSRRRRRRWPSGAPLPSPSLLRIQRRGTLILGDIVHIINQITIRPLPLIESP